MISDCLSIKENELVESEGGELNSAISESSVSLLFSFLRIKLRLEEINREPYSEFYLCGTTFVVTHFDAIPLDMSQCAFRRQRLIERLTVASNKSYQSVYGVYVYRRAENEKFSLEFSSKSPNTSAVFQAFEGLPQLTEALCRLVKNYKNEFSDVGSIAVPDYQKPQDYAQLNKTAMYYDMSCSVTQFKQDSTTFVHKIATPVCFLENTPIEISCWQVLNEKFPGKFLPLMDSGRFNNKFFIVLPKAPHYNPKDFIDVFYLTQSVLESLRLLQKAKIVHRGIRRSNILYNEISKSAVLIDFDHAVFDDCREQDPLEFGVFPYSAPESPRSFPSEIWSIGALVARMMEEKMGFPAENYEDYPRVGLFLKRLKLNVSAGVQESLFAFLERALVENPVERITAEGALRLLHSFMMK